MKREFSKNTTEVFTKTIFHYVPEILKYIDEIKEARKRHGYLMRYLIMSEILMFLSEGKSQRFTETAFEETKYLENISKITKEKIKKIPDAEIYTNVFSRIEKEEMEKFQYKINYQMIRNKIYEESKILGKYNLVLDGTRFQKAHYEINKEWLKETIEGKTIWYISMLELKLVILYYLSTFFSIVSNFSYSSVLLYKILDQSLVDKHIPNFNLSLISISLIIFIIFSILFSSITFYSFSLIQNYFSFYPYYLFLLLALLFYKYYWRFHYHCRQICHSYINHH